jgi:protein involved in polysaccharide export with SLBB domain
MNQFKFTKLPILIFIVTLAISITTAQVGKPVENAVTNQEVQTPVKDVVTDDFSPDVKMFGRSLFETGGNIFMPSPDAPVPDNYELGTGDKLEVVCWSGNVEYERSVQVITPTGDIFLKTLGNIPITRKTITEVRRDLRIKYSKIYTTFDLTVNLVGQRTIPVFVMGEAKKPGKYFLPSLATVFTALFSAGGPTDIGSIRNIKLMRGTKMAVQIDIYEYLFYGKYVDQPLQSGDTIYIPMSGKVVSVYGAVNRPAKYELLKENTVDEMLTIAGGITSKASNKMRIMRLDSVAGRTVLELLNDNIGKQEKLQNGDEVYVRPVLDVLQNAVTVIGSVNRPGPFPADMAPTVSKLIAIAGGLIDDDAYIEQAVITRLRDDSSTYQIPFNLRAVMEGKPGADVKLQPKDTMKILSKKNMVQSLDMVTIQGAVTKSGAYPYLKGMKISDLVNLGFGTTVDAYLKQAHLYRFPVTITNTGAQSPGQPEVLMVDLADILEGNKKSDLELKPRDVLKVYNRAEVTELQDIVSVAGEVVKPGTYPFYPGMRIADLLKVSFGTTTNAYLDQAFIYRYPSAGTTETKKETIIVNISKVMNGDKDANVELKQRDSLKIFNRAELTEINDTVSISGEVVKAGSFPYKADMRVSDLLDLSFGTTTNAYLDQAFIYRFPAAGTTETKKETIIINISDIISGKKIANIELKPRDAVKVFNRSELTELNDTVSISGEVVKAGSFPYKKDMRVSDLLDLSFGTTTNAYLDQAFIYRFPATGTTETKKETIIINISDIISGKKIANVELKPRDAVKIFNRSELPELNDIVTINGEVVKAGTFPYRTGMKISDLLKLSFGTTVNAYLDQAHLYRYPMANIASTIADNQQDIMIINLNNVLNGDKIADIELKPRDTIKVYKREEVNELIGTVTISGEVVKPGVYPYTTGMKVSDLIAKAFGITIKAYLKTAQLYRFPNSNESQFMSFSLEDALSKKVGDDFLLQARDRIEIKANADVIETFITVSGEVNKPLSMPYYKGMKVSDAIFMAGGLKINVALDKALIVRLDESTMSEKMIEISLRDAMSKKESDIELNRRDRLFIYPKENLGEAQSVTISGAVSAPGIFPHVAGITVNQLVFLAKGLLNNCYMERANLYRVREDKTTEIITVNLLDAQNNVKDTNIVLNPGDKLSILTREEMMDNKSVVVRGYVRKAAELPLTVGMKLSDALALSGGLKVDAERKVVLFRTLNGETKSMEYEVKVNENTFTLAVDPILENKDLITVRGDSNFVAMTETVNIGGNVLHPGTYPAFNGNRLNAKTLYQLINEAGGIIANGYPSGLVLYRPDSSVQTPEQKREMNRLLRDMDTGSGVVSTKIPIAQPGQTAQQTEQQNVNALSSQVAKAISSDTTGKIIILTPPRNMQDQQIALTIPVEADKIINSKGKKGDFNLLPGDTIYVPDIPTTVTVLGGVFSNGSVVFDNGKNLNGYVNSVGGFSKDAETDHLVILRMNGTVMPAKKSSKILPGDVIIVPTTFIVKNIRTDNLFEASLRTLSQLAISYMPFKK